MKRLAGLLLVSSCISATPSTNPQAQPVTQLVVVDAGSSGTRARVFEFVEGQPESLRDLGGGCENDEPLALDIEGLLASYACARPLLLDPAHTPVLVYATGGMRTLAEQQPEQAEQRHAEVIAALREQGVLEVESRTITGVDEGLYQWIGINHQDQRLHDLRSAGGDELDETLTIIEFGGASVQVAFALAPEQSVSAAIAADEVQSIELGGVVYRVFSRSYLHCGMNEAREALAGPACFPSDCKDSPTCAAALPRSLSEVETTGGPLAACELGIEAALQSDAACTALRSPPPPLPDRPVRLVAVLGSLFEGLDAVDERDPEHHVDLARARARAEQVCASEAADPSEAADLPTKAKSASSCFAAAHALLILEGWGLAAGDPRPGLGTLDHSWTWGVARARLDRR